MSFKLQVGSMKTGHHYTMYTRSPSFQVRLDTTQQCMAPASDRLYMAASRYRQGGEQNLLLHRMHIFTPIENSHDCDALGVYGTCLRILKEVYLQTAYLL